MTKEVRDYVAQKTKEMMEAFSCSAEAKAAGQAWLDALGTENEAAETEKYIAELEGDIMPIDMLIAFAESGRRRRRKWRHMRKKLRRRARNTATARHARRLRRSSTERMKC